ncbi:MAG: polyribonucleotide nucleotidyltransferase [Bacteroidota bacterium]
MIPNPVSVSLKLDDGRELSIETGRMARQADGSAVVRLGNCMILATVVASKEPKPGQSFFPLTVDYQEKFASAGRIPGSFFKREARLNDYEILTSRLIDRALRPLFPDDYLCEVQVLVTLISSDAEVMPDALACLAASAALAVSDVPIQEVISEARIGRINGEYVVNPSRTALKDADINIIVAATAKNIMMVEGEAKECEEAGLLKAIEVAHAAINSQIALQIQLRDKVGAPAKRDYTKPYTNPALEASIAEFGTKRIYDIAKGALGKHERTSSFKQVREDFKAQFTDESALKPEDAALVGMYFHDLEKKVIRDMMIDERVRLDGRSLDQVRPLTIETDPLPSPHGSALFTRGETQSLTTVTLGTVDDELLSETAQTSDYVKFMLHYNFPPFSTGEVKMMRGQSRREVGHGALAMRSLKQMLPAEYPYTVRIVSDILESNGSSSMATVCAGSLALMDAGVPFPKHVSGVAMGLISGENGKFAVLTDILGDEDHLGDMDFKVTGTRDGICGIQMDIKVDGLSHDIMNQALEQARRGRLHILDAMYESISAPRAELKPHAPRIEQVNIDREFIGAVIGPGGKIIQEIQRETGAKINIEEVGEEGIIKIFSANKESIDKALAWIRGIVAIPEIGGTYEGTVKSIVPFGAFVEFMPGKQGLLHISEVSWKRLESLDGVLKEGDKVKIQLTGTDPKTGKLRLSRKVLMPKPDGYVEPEKRERREGGDDRRGGGDRDRGDRRGGSSDRRSGGGGGGERRDGGNRERREDRPQREHSEAKVEVTEQRNEPPTAAEESDMAL